MSRPLQAAIVALTVVVAGAPVVAVGLRRVALLDIPNQRSSHHVATPRGGGIAIAFGLSSAMLVTQPDSDHAWLLLGLSLGYALLGLLDDIKDLGPFVRLSLQFVLGAVGGLALVDWAGALGIAQVFVATVWLAGFVNSFNFMDGVNGISSLTSITLGATWWVIGLETEMPLIAIGGAALAGAALGFLPWNAPRARVFLGDVGSYLIGAWIALLTVVAWTDGLNWWLAVAPESVYLADTTVTATRRVLRGECWYESHREHVYQRVVDAGWSHMGSAVFVSGCTGMVGAVTVAIVSDRLADPIGLGIVVTVVLLYLSTPRLLARRMDRSQVLA
jgi:UDP-GlcNAc:undecaprenyl-phosphate/decaprenyl-phosphate GlcNAc-1-phosphate transferase